MENEAMDFLAQLLDSAEKAGEKLEESFEIGDYETFNRMKKFIVQLEEKICGVANEL